MRLISVLLVMIGLLVLVAQSRAGLPTGVTVTVTKEPELVFVVNPNTKVGRWYVTAQVTVTVPDPSPVSYGVVSMNFPDYPDAGVTQSFTSDPLTPGDWVCNFYCPAPFGFSTGGGWVTLSTFFSGPGVFYEASDYWCDP